MKKIRLMLIGALLLVGALGLVGCSNAANGDDSSTSKETNANSGATPIALTMESIVDEKGFSFTAGSGKATLAITSAKAGSDGKFTGNLSFIPPSAAATQTGTYTATPVKDKAATYDLIVVYSDKTSGAYRVEIKDKDNILVWKSSISYTASGNPSTATGTPTNAGATGMAKAVATSAYKIGESEGHTILIKSAEEKGDGKYSGEAQYVFERVNLDLSGTYNATPIDDSTSEYYCEFFFNYNNGITHMGFKLTISDDGKTLDLTKLTFGVMPPTVDGTAATRNK